MNKNLKNGQKKLVDMQKKQSEYVAKLEQVTAKRTVTMSKVASSLQGGADVEQLSQEVINLDGKAAILTAAIEQAQAQEQVVIDDIKNDALAEGRVRWKEARRVIDDIHSLAKEVDVKREELDALRQDIGALTSGYQDGGVAPMAIEVQIAGAWASAVWQHNINIQQLSKGLKHREAKWTEIV